MANDERNNDIISEQVFSKEQIKSDFLDERRFKATEAIEDRELADREPSNPLALETGFDELDSSISPQADSPGDSEADAAAELMLGIAYRPETEDPFEEEEDDEIEDFEKTDRTVYAEQKSSSASETPSLEEESGILDESIDEKARVISAGRPSPRSDAGSVTSAN